MPAAKKQRGATAIRNNSETPLRWRGKNGYLVAGSSVLAIVALLLLLAPFDKQDSIAPEQPAARLQVPDDIKQEAPFVASLDDGTLISTDAPSLPPEQPWHEETVKRGDNLSLVFKRAGYTTRDVYNVTSQAEDGDSLARIYPGQTIAFQADTEGQLKALRHVKSPLETITYLRSEDGFSSLKETREPAPRETWATGEITSSLFLAGQEAGLSQPMIMELANVFGGVIDFVLDPRKGDTIYLVYEELYLDGEKYKDGNIVAASFTNQGETFNAYRYEDSNGDVNYYNESGVSMRKAFLLAPVDFTRISSNFNLRRLHPIYKTTRPHRGIDYAASTGTPVYAAGDGRVIKAGYSRSNGNYVFIQHGEQYVTKYLHLHKRKVKQGQRVSQSQVIGTVGSTGAATGPHLHYEFLVNGVHRNPRTIHKTLPKAKALPADEMPRFQEAISQRTLQLASLRSNNQLAMNSEPGLASQ
tara:strand:+ start:1869 stop:3281 length:1413 start_codon:yes stop_codon:yes gene_type:complete